MTSIVERLDRALAARNVAAPIPASLPLAVDLDHTLIMSDSLQEGLVAYFRTPGNAAGLFRALRGGKGAFRREVARGGSLDPTHLPYNKKLLAFLAEERKSGRRMGLFTAADQSVADRIADHIGCFDVVRGSDGTTNLDGDAKLAAIRETFGARFAYAGHVQADGRIFEAAESVVLSGSVDRRISLPKDKRIEAAFAQGSVATKIWVDALRPRHWVKNIAVFIAPILAFQSLSVGAVASAVLLFGLFCLLASATYLVSDLRALEIDRRHPNKRLRPLAAGALAIRDGFLAAVAMTLAVGLFGLLLPPAAQACLFAYLAIKLVYGLFLTRIPMMDVVVSTTLSMVRIVAGGTLLPLPVSPWLLTFSVLFFLGLSTLSRYAEVEREVRTNAKMSRSEDYTERDLPILLSAGVASHISAIATFMIYIVTEVDQHDAYRTPAILWGLMPIVLVWTLRAWHLGTRGQMKDDPVLFALTDRVSLVLAFLAGLILVVAWI